MISIDRSELPLLRLRSAGHISDQEFERYLSELEELLLMPQSYAIVFDARDARIPSSRQARRQAEWMKQFAPRLRESRSGTAFVISSPAIRGVLRAILWMQPMPGRYTVAETIEEGERWARMELTRRLAQVASAPNDHG